MIERVAKILEREFSGDDLGEAYLALVVAADAWFAKGMTGDACAYCLQCARRAGARAKYRLCETIHTPKWVKVVHNGLLEVKKDLAEAFGRTPVMGEIAEETGFSTRRIIRIFESVDAQTDEFDDRLGRGRRTD